MLSPTGVSLRSIFGAASKGYARRLKALAPVALVESTSFALLTLIVSGLVDASSSNLFVLQGAALSLSAGAWILSAFAAAEVGIHEEHSSETAFQRVRRRVGALLGVTLVVNALGFALMLWFLWVLPSTVDGPDEGWGDVARLLMFFLIILGGIALVTNLAVSVLMIEDCSAREAWGRAMDLVPSTGAPMLGVASLTVLALPLVAGIAAGAAIGSVTGTPAGVSEFSGGIAAETVLGPFVAAFLVGVYVYLRDRQVAEAVGVVASPSSVAE